MTVRKIIIYQRYATKPVILTDYSDGTDKIQSQVLEMMRSDKISILETQNDILVIRPSEVQSVLITKSNPENDFSQENNQPPKNTNDKKDKPYINKLSMETK